MDIKELIKQSGKDIDLSKLPEGSLDAFGLVAGVVIEQKLASVKEDLTGSVSGSVSEAVKASLAESLRPIEDRLGKVEGAGGKPPADNKPADPTGEVAALRERLEKFEQAQQETAAQAGRRQKAEAYLDKHFPNLRPVDRDKVIARVQAKNVEGDQSLKAEVEGHREELKALGVPDTDKWFSADPVKEGAEEDRAKSDESKRFEDTLSKASQESRMAVGQRVG